MFLLNCCVYFWCKVPKIKVFFKIKCLFFLFDLKTKNKVIECYWNSLTSFVFLFSVFFFLGNLQWQKLKLMQILTNFTKKLNILIWLNYAKKCYQRSKTKRISSCFWLISRLFKRMFFERKKKVLPINFSSWYWWRIRHNL